MQVSLKAARITANRSVKEIASILGVTPRCVRNWENGKTIPNAIQFRTMHQLYGVSAEEIFLPTATTKSGQSATNG